MGSDAWFEVTDWRTRDGVHQTRPDPYVVWAQATNWDDYTATPWNPLLPWHCRLIRWLMNLFGLLSALPCEPPADRYRAVIIELNNIGGRVAFLAQAGLQTHIRVPEMYGIGVDGAATPTDDYAKFLTAFVDSEGLKQLALPNPSIGQYVARFDLCEYIKPGRPPAELFITGQPFPDGPPVTEGSQLLGVIDDGCPFAHCSFWSLVNGKPSTRIAALWDQNEIRAAFSNSLGFGNSPKLFVSGWETRRSYPVPPPQPAPNWKGLDDCLWAHFDPATRSIDEDACYDDADYQVMKRRVVHGPHVVDVAAGPTKWRDTIYIDRDTPPGCDPAPLPPPMIDCAADRSVTDIVWVQLPQGGLQDSSGGWLDSRILDALRYVLWCRSAQTKKTVVSLSYGSTVGPHDGTSILATALDAVIAAIPNGELHVVIAAGNSFDASGHAICNLQAGQAKTLDWCVLPGGESPSFLQIWLPADTWSVTVTPPQSTSAQKVGGDHVWVWPSQSKPSASVIYMKSSSRGAGPMVLVAVAPTAIEDDDSRSPAAHGDWRVEVTATSAGVAHAYIARNDLDIDAVLRGRQSVFVDLADDPDPELRNPVDDPGKSSEDDHLFGAGMRNNAILRRRGTVNGIGTGAAPIVVAGHQRNYSDNLLDRTHAPYSSAGTIADSRGRLPNTSYPTDESDVLRGVRAAGSRSGSSYRLIGTSTAAPQHARFLLAKPSGVKTGPPPAPPVCDPEILGNDCGRPADLT